MKPLQNFRVVLAVTLLAFVTGCSWFNFGRSENSNTQVREALEVPPDLARPAGTDLSAPTAAQQPAMASSQPAERTPDALPVATADSRVRLERDGAQRWLVVEDAPEKVWIKLRGYFVSNNMQLVLDDPRAKLLETDWIKRPVDMGSGVFGTLLGKLHSTGIRDKFRVRVEPGRTPGTSEVYVSQQGMEEVVTESVGVNVMSTAWQPRPTDPEMEAELMFKLMRHLGVSEAQAKTQVADSNAGGRVQRVKDALQLPEDLDSAWRRVGVALDRSGVTIEDRDRSAGIYYVRYVDSASGKRSGLLSFLSGGADGQAGPDKRKEGPKDRFQVLLAGNASGTSVRVLNVKGEPDDTGSGERLLVLLQQQLR